MATFGFTWWKIDRAREGAFLALFSSKLVWTTTTFFSLSLFAVFKVKGDPPKLTKIGIFKKEAKFIAL